MNYILSKAEIKQNNKTSNLFNKFDIDGSGSLDTSELASLY